MYRIFAGRLLTMATLLAVAALTACASPEDALPPRISVVNIALARPGLLRQDFHLDLRIANPNDFDIPIEGLTFRLDVDGEPFAEGMSNKSVTVPRLSEVAVPVKASTDTFSLLRQIIALGRSEAVRYRISGVAYIAGLAGARPVPYERKGSLALLPPAPHETVPGGGIRRLAPM